MRLDIERDSPAFGGGEYAFDQPGSFIVALEAPAYVQRRALAPILRQLLRKHVRFLRMIDAPLPQNRSSSVMSSK